jgi:hypothetical protein
MYKVIVLNEQDVKNLILKAFPDMELLSAVGEVTLGSREEEDYEDYDEDDEDLSANNTEPEWLGFVDSHEALYWARRPEADMYWEVCVSPRPNGWYWLPPSNFNYSEKNLPNYYIRRKGSDSSGVKMFK